MQAQLALIVDCQGQLQVRFPGITLQLGAPCQSMGLVLQVKRQFQGQRRGLRPAQVQVALQRAAPAGAGQFGGQLLDVQAERQPGQRGDELLRVGCGSGLPLTVLGGG
ncbi:hypothetical protein D3C85_660370 [compost metagenome]